MTDAIVAKGLVKHYGSVKAIDGVDLSVPEGTVMALLGPNGAGKTTIVRVLTTLLLADAGEATVAGYDVRRDGARLRQVIGLSGQYAAVDENLTGYENLDMVGRLYQLGKTKAKARALELLERFDLVDAANRPAKTYSGGMRRRLDLAGSLVGEPRVLFLDEPTTGLDPRSRLEMWDVIGELVRGGSTLLLTTQYLEEADRLADCIAVIDHGKVIALGSSDELKGQLGGERLEVTVATEDEVAKAVDVLAGIGLSTPKSDSYSRAISVAVSGGPPVLIEALRQLEEAGVKVVDVGIHRPTLDDVFLALTGRDTSAGDQA